MELDLKSHIVSFIDVLGFSSMVTHDCGNPKSEQKYINSLYEIHKKTKKIANKLEGLTVSQFSDSVVLAIPYSKNNFNDICKIVSDFQYDLLTSGILCRGGMSYGKHFSTEDFIFSHGLIEAYKIESEVASTPRVVIGKELIDLVYGKFDQVISDLIIKENDNLFFIEYLNGGNSGENKIAISKCIPNELSENPSIRAKQLWLIEYFNHKFPADVIRDNRRFVKCLA